MKFEVPPNCGEKKLVAFLRGELHFSYSLVSSLRHTDGALLRNGEHVRTIDRVNPGDIITVSVPQGECRIEPVEMPLCILYKDEDMLALNKPPTIAMHPTHGHRNNTLANGAAYYLQNRGHSGAFRSVGRLDKGTSGVVLCALNPYAAARLSETAEKTYMALCEGELCGQGIIDVPIYRPDPDKTLRACDPGGQNGERAVTHYEALKTGNGMTLLRLKLETGRTHQIRVHMAHMGFPLVGDALYGTTREDVTHQLLHCAEVRAVHPYTGERMVFSAPLPDEFLMIQN
ncbi:MAG: RluA family pseudouridine synthase [Oscillospiraceae bacterium]|nr:RluA family pseudouridine synthase [Oscillospiraceae bacterium]